MEEQKAQLVVEGPYKMSVTWKDGMSDEEKASHMDLIQNMMSEFNKMAKVGVIPDCFEEVSYKRI